LLTVRGSILILSASAILVATFALAYSIPSSRHLLLFPRHLADHAFFEQLRTKSF
jgi:hypothetical protein